MRSSAAPSRIIITIVGVASGRAHFFRAFYRNGTSVLCRVYGRTPRRTGAAKTRPRIEMTFADHVEEDGYFKFKTATKTMKVLKRTAGDK